MEMLRRLILDPQKPGSPCIPGRFHRIVGTFKAKEKKKKKVFSVRRYFKPI